MAIFRRVGRESRERKPPRQSPNEKDRQTAALPSSPPWKLGGLIFMG